MIPLPHIPLLHYAVNVVAIRPERRREIFFHGELRACRHGHSMPRARGAVLSTDKTSLKGPLPCGPGLERRRARQQAGLRSASIRYCCRSGKTALAIAALPPGGQENLVECWLCRYKRAEYMERQRAFMNSRRVNCFYCEWSGDFGGHLFSRIGPKL